MHHINVSIILRQLLIVLQWSLLVSIAIIAFNRYSPLLFSFHALTLPFVIICTLILLLSQRRFNRLSASAGGVLLMIGMIEGQFHYQRYVVLNSDPNVRQVLSGHLLVGYHDFDEIKYLLDQQFVSGVFLTQRNIQDLSLPELQALTTELQDSPLRWLATDQEGGLVQRLSPPLPRQASLQTVIANAGTQWPAAVRDYAHNQGAALASVGINLNFAPVVDLPQQANFWDRRSYISARVLAKDPATIARAGQLYSAELLATGVLPSLKHFPGLGRITADTHFFNAPLTTDLATLAATDWQPFRQISQQLPVAMMLAHVQLTALDDTYPVSFSPTVIRWLREQWQYDGVLVTDDFAMLPVYHSWLGSGGAAVQALNSGVDLILLAYDSRLFYPVMYALLRAHAQGTLDTQQLAVSQARQQRMLTLLKTPSDNSTI